MRKMIVPPHNWQNSCKRITPLNLLIFSWVSPVPGSNMSTQETFAWCNKLGRNAGFLNQLTQDRESDANAAEINNET